MFIRAVLIKPEIEGGKGFGEQKKRAVREYTKKVEGSCSCVLFPVPRMRPGPALSPTFPGRVKLTQVESRLTEGVNFKQAN